MKHRGRIQSQGGKINDSESWCEKSGVKADVARKKVKTLNARSRSPEKRLRKEAFDKTIRFINSAEAKGGVTAPVSKTNLVKNDKKGRRVDIEVISGKAFLP